MKNSDDTDKRTGRNGALNCRDVLHLCNAMCCKLGGGVALNPDEIKSGEYETETFCLEKRERCAKDQDCYHKITQLKTTEEGHCVYLGEDNLCTIRDRWPKMCAEYFCASGRWDDWKRDPSRFMDRELLRLGPGVVFAPNPSRRLLQVIVPEEGKKVFMLIRDNSICDDVMAGGAFDPGGVKENMLMDFYSSFDGETELAELEKNIDQGALPVFRRFAVLLATQKLILNRRG